MDYSPRQQLFDKVFMVSEEMGFDTHLNNPAEGTTYPFVVVDPVAMTSRKLSKNRIAGRLTSVVHLWSHESEVGKHDEIMNTLENRFIKLHRLNNVFVDFESINPRTLNVTEGNEKLQHGIIEVVYTFN